MPEALKLVLVMCAWALACLLGLQIVPKGPWPVTIYALVSLLALTWIVPLVMMDRKSADAMLKTTFMWWAGTAAAAFIVVLAIG